MKKTDEQAVNEENTVFSVTYWKVETKRLLTKV